MSTKEDEASVGGRETVCSQLTMRDTLSAEGEEVGEAHQIKTACAWAQREQALEGARERISAGVLVQTMEGDGMDSLWRVLSVIEGATVTRRRRRR